MTHLRALSFSLCLLSLGAAGVARAQSNIVFNGSFELLDSGWNWTGTLGVHWNAGAAEGTNHVSVMTDLWQDLNTVPGRDYVLSFAAGQSALPALQVSWGDTVLAGFTNLATSGMYWQYVYRYVTATSSVTRLRFVSSWPWGVILDDVKVGWLYEPLRITVQPQSRTGLEGGTVTFSVRGDGAPPLSYEWQFNGSPIARATNAILVLADLRAWQAGAYAALVSNLAGARLSEAAQLEVMPPPTSPVIITQPASDTFPVGYGGSLGVVAVGEPPLLYQWRLGGVDLPGATNASLIFNTVNPANAGVYTVFVSNPRGSALSLPAVLAVTDATGGGKIAIDTATNNAAAYDVDGTTRLTGSNFIAQVFAGPSPVILRPLGAPVSFLTGQRAGYVSGVFRTIPDVPVNEMTYVQLRAWETSRGASYEEARAHGGKYGCSPIASVRTSPLGTFVPLQGFSLRTGLPFFFTGRLSVGGRLPDGTWEFRLTGEPGFRYLIEKRQPPANWVPFLTVTNTTGVVAFLDPEQHGSSLQFYRSRMLD